MFENFRLLLGKRLGMGRGSRLRDTDDCDTGGSSGGRKK